MVQLARWGQILADSSPERRLGTQWEWSVQERTVSGLEHLVHAVLEWGLSLLAGPETQLGSWGKEVVVGRSHGEALE